MNPMYLENGLKGKNRWWRYLVSFLVVVSGIVFGNIPLGVFLVVPVLMNNGAGVQHFRETMDFSYLGLSDAVGLLLIMCPFIFGLAALLFSVKVIHRKKIIDLLTGNGRFRFSRFFLAGGIWLFLGILADLISWLINPEDYTFSFNAVRFIPVMIMALVTVPLQAGLEETFFRGYLSQGLTNLLKNKCRKLGRILPILINGTLFGLMHVANPEIVNYGMLYMLPQYILMGLILSVVSVMDDGLEAALGIHTANNLYGILFVNFEGTAIQMPSLFTASNYNPKIGLVAMVIFTAVILVLFKVVFRWPGFSKITAPLETDNNIIKTGDPV